MDLGCEFAACVFVLFCFFSFSFFPSIAHLSTHMTMIPIVSLWVSGRTACYFWLFFDKDQLKICLQ